MVHIITYVFPPHHLVGTMDKYNHLYISYYILVYLVLIVQPVCGAQALMGWPYGQSMVWAQYTQNSLMVALAYILRNSLFYWIFNIQWDILITNFPASVPKYLLDGNLDLTKYWSINENRSSPIQISCIREYPGDGIIN